MYNESNGVSAVIICKNAESHILAVVEALMDVDEILVYDTGSTDKTVEILENCHWVTVRRGAFRGFGQTKSHAISLAKFDWILSLDADEVANPELITACYQFAENPINFLGSIRRKNYFMNEEIHYSGWGNDWLIRFFNRSHTNFNETAVHEAVRVPVNSKVTRLNGYIKHYAVDNVAQLATKTLFYSKLRSDSNQSVTIAILKAAWKFFHTYILRLGVLDGRRGLLIAHANAIGTFWRHTIRLFNSNEQR